MVRITSCLWKAKRTFFDSLRIIACGGRGGNGLPKYGGVGGKGGDVYLEAHEEYTLKQLKLDFPDKRFSAEPGEHSRRFAILGAPGKDCIVKCPPGISVLTDQKIKIGEVDQPGEKLLVCKGGRGGGPDNEYIGEKGQVMPIVLDLKLLADIGFVGFPNAGKSTLLSAISSAKPKIANYPFTTIQPSVGTICYSDLRKITAADLPGLIEGSHLNRGMGHKFLKHCLRTQILLFVVDINGFRLSPKFPHRNAIETILYLNKELEMYNKELISKPAILAINKCDTDEDGTKFEAIQDSLKVLSIYSSNLQPEMKPEKLIKFDAVLSISAKHGINISLLKDKLRTFIDIYNEEKEIRQKEEEMKRKQVTVSTNPEYDVVYV